MLVIDNTGPTVDAPVVGRADNVEALLNMLSEVRDARTNPVEQPAAEPGGEEPAEADGGIRLNPAFKRHAALRRVPGGPQSRPVAFPDSFRSKNALGSGLN